MIRRNLLAVVLVLMTVVGFAQTPSLINYQGAARDAAGAAITNSAISVKFEFLQGAGLNSVFTETQSIVTNSLGLFSTQIGKNTTGGVSAVDFSAGALQLRVSVDMTAGSNFVVVGTQSLVNVPFAFYASDVPTTYTNNVLTIGKTSYTLNGSGAVYTAGNGISIVSNSVINTAPDQTVTISPGNSNVTVNGSYPNFSVSASPSLSILAPGTLSITNGNSVSIDPGLTYNAGILTVGSSANSVNIGASVPTASIQGGGAATVATLAPNSYSVSVPATSLNPGTNVTIGGAFPNYTVSATPSLSLLSPGTMSITGGNSVNITPALSISGNTLTSGPTSNSVVIPSTPNTSISATGGGISVTNPLTNSFVLNVPSTSLTPGTNVAITGSHPNYTINAAPTLTLVGNNLTISGGNTIPLPSNTIVAVTTTVTGGGAINVTTVAASNYSVSYTPSLTMLGANTMSIVGGNSVTLAPSLSISGSTLTVGPASNTIALPATSTQSLSVLSPGTLSITGGNSVSIAQPLSLTGNTLTVGPPSNSIALPSQTAQTLSYGSNTLNISNGNVVTIAPSLALTGNTLTVGPATNTIAIPSQSAQTLSLLSANSLSISNGNSVAIAPSLSISGNTITVGPATNTLALPGLASQSLSVLSPGTLSITGGNSVNITPALSISGNTITSGPASNSIVIPTQTAQTLSYGSNTLNISNGNVVTIAPSLGLTGNTLTVGPATNTIALPSQTAQTLSYGSNTLNISNGNVVTIAPSLGLTGNTLTVGPATNTIALPSQTAQTLSYGSNTLNISNGNVVTIAPSLGLTGNTLTVGPATNTIALPSQTAQTLSYGSNTLNISNGNVVTIAPSLGLTGNTLTVGPATNTIALPSQTAQTLSYGSNTLNISNGNVVTIAPSLGLTGNTLTVGPATNTIALPSQTAQTLSYGSNTLNISNGNVVTIAPSLGLTGNTLTVGPATNTIALPSQTAQTLSYGSNTLNISNGNVVTIAPSLSVTGNVLTVGPASNTVALTTPNLTGGGAVSVATISTNNYSISAPQTQLNNGTNVNVTGTFPSYTVNATPLLTLNTNTLSISGGNTVVIPAQVNQSLSLLSANTLSISNGNSVNIAPSLTATNNVLQVGPSGNTIALQTPNFVSSGAASISTLGVNSYSVDVPQTQLTQGANVTISGSFPSYTVAATPSLVLAGTTLSITNGNSVALPPAAISGAGMATVNTSGNNFTVGVAPLAFQASSGNLSSGTSSVNITPAASIAGSVVTIGPATNTIGITGLLSGGTASYVPRWTNANTLSSTSTIFDDGTNVGIGTNAPSQKLDVTGYIRMGAGAGAANEGWLIASPSPGISLIQAGGRATTDARIVQSNAAPLSFYTNATERMRIDASGNVGVLNNAPSVPLDVTGQTEFFTTALSTGYESDIQNNTGSAVSSGALRAINSGVRSIGNNAVSIQNTVTKAGGSNSIKTGLEILSTGAWGTGGSGGHYNRALYAEASGGVDGNYAGIFMGGNVGIGNLTPNAPLQFTNTTVNRKIVLYETANNDHQFYGLGVNGGIFRYQVDATTANHVFYAGTGASTSNELMRITGTGNVGVGTDVPAFNPGSSKYVSIAAGSTYSSGTAALELAGGSGTNSIPVGKIDFNSIFTAGTTGTNIARIAAHRTGSVYWGVLAFSTNNGTLAERMRIDENGNVGIGTTAPSQELSVGTGPLEKFTVDGADGNMAFKDQNASITFPQVSGTAPAMINMFNTGTGNSDRMVVAHSPGYPNWGLQYSDLTDRFNFVQNGNGVLTVDLSNMRVGVKTGTAVAPAADFHVAGTTRLADGTQGVDKVLRSDANGNATWVNSSINTGFSAYALSTPAQSFGSTATTVQFGGEEFDDGSNFSSSVYTAPSAGVYHFDASVTFAASVGATSWIFVYIYKNSTQMRQVLVPASDAYYSAQISANLDLAIGDQVTIRVSNQGVVTKSLHLANAGYNYFTGYRIY